MTRAWPRSGSPSARRSPRAERGSGSRPSTVTGPNVPVLCLPLLPYDGPDAPELERMGGPACRRLVGHSLAAAPPSVAVAGRLRHACLEPHVAHRRARHHGRERCARLLGGGPQAPAGHRPVCGPVSYTHLTLPTIY